MENALGKPYTVLYGWALFMFMPYLWYGSCDTLAIDPEAVAAQGVSSWTLYMWTNVLFYTLQTCLLFPLVIKCLGQMLRCTCYLPFCLRFPISVLGFQGLVCLGNILLE